LERWAKRETFPRADLEREHPMVPTKDSPNEAITTAIRPQANAAPAQNEPKTYHSWAEWKAAMLNQLFKNKASQDRQAASPRPQCSMVGKKAESSQARNKYLQIS
jgi:hypothetical protein